MEIVHQLQLWFVYIEECISERKVGSLKREVSTKLKLDIYKWFGESIEFQKYLHGICDAGSRCLFKFGLVHMV